MIPLIIPILVASASAAFLSGCSSEEEEAPKPQPQPPAPISRTVIPDNYVKIDCLAPLDDIYVAYHARVGNYDEALACAQQTGDQLLKLKALHLIKAEMEKTGLSSAKVAEQLGNLLASSPTFGIWNGAMLAQLVGANLENGQILEILDLEADQTVRAKALIEIAAQLVRDNKGYPTELIREIKEIATANVTLAVEIVASLAAANFLEEAANLNESLPDNDLRLRGCLRMAEATSADFGREKCNGFVNEALEKVAAGNSESHIQLNNLLDVAATMAKIGSPEAQLRKVFQRALNIARNLPGDDPKYPPPHDYFDPFGNVIGGMVEAGLYKQAFDASLARRPSYRDSYIKQIVVTMLDRGLYKECYQMAQGVTTAKLGGFYHYYAEIIRFDLNEPELKAKIDILARLMRKNVEEVNPWLMEQKNQRVSYLRPVYEAATVLGNIALAARKAGNADLVNYISQKALPGMTAMLSYRNPRPNFQHGDYGLVYIIFPMKIYLYQALVNLGDPSAIPALRACPELCAVNARGERIEYHSEYDNEFYYVGSIRDMVKEYLTEQKAAGAKFVEPRNLTQYGWDKGPFGTDRSPFGF
jgi:hypothetical protein